MATEVQRRRGTAAEHDSFVGAPAEITVVTDDWTLRVHDGVTPGGHGIQTSTDKTLSSFISGDDISGHTIVSRSADTVIPSDPTDNTSVYNIVGLTNQAAANGSSIEVITSGIIHNDSWSLLDGPVFLGANGILTQTAPTSGYLVVVGYPASSKDIRLNISQPIKIA
jgi:hypothetical protein